MRSRSVVPFIYSLFLMPFFPFLFLSAGINPTFALMVCLALLIALLSINGFAYFIRYSFFFFLYIKLQAHNSLVNIDFREVMFQYNCLIIWPTDFLFSIVIYHPYRLHLEWSVFMMPRITSSAVIVSVVAYELIWLSTVLWNKRASTLGTAYPNLCSLFHWQSLLETLPSASGMDWDILTSSKN